MLNADFANQYAEKDREEKQIDQVAEMIERDVTSSILATPMPGLLSPGTTTTLVSGGIGPHLRDTVQGQMIALTAGGDPVATAEMESEAQLANVLFSVARQAIDLGAISAGDVNHVFKSDWGLGRDRLFRRVDEMIWKHEGIPEKEWPEVNYNLGHPMSAFGFDGVNRGFLDPDRKDARALSARRPDSTESNLQITTNSSMGRPVLKDGKTQFTALLRNQPKWTNASEVLTSVAQDIGISQSARDVMMLGEPTVIVVTGMQVPTKDDGSQYWQWLLEWNSGLKRNRDRDAQTTSRVGDYWTTANTAAINLHKSYVTNQKGEMFSRVTGDRIREKPKPGGPLSMPPGIGLY